MHVTAHVKLPASHYASPASLSHVGLLADARGTAMPLAGRLNVEHAVGSIFGTTLGAFDALDLSDEAKDKIHFDDAQRLLGMQACR